MKNVAAAAAAGRKIEILMMMSCAISRLKVTSNSFATNPCGTYQHIGT